MCNHKDNNNQLLPSNKTVSVMQCQNKDIQDLNNIRIQVFQILYCGLIV